MSPATWRAILKPLLGRIYGLAKKNGRVVFHHSCGHIVPIVGDLIDLGLDILHPIQPDLYIRRNYSYGTDISRTGTTRVFVHQIHVDNYGTAPASGVRLNVGLEAEDEHMWDENTRTIGGMPLNSFFDYNVSGLRVPTRNTFRIVISVSGDNFNAVDSKTGWIRWN